MTFTLRRASGEPLMLTREHDALTLPRKGTIAWESFSPTDFTPAQLAQARALWKHRAFTEFHSLTLFTQLATQVQLLGAPLDWSGAFARMVADEVRHTELCLRMVRALGGDDTLSLDETQLQQPVEGSLRAHVRKVVLTAFCIGETLSGRMFKRCVEGATVPLAREVVIAILVDETFHGELGWELGALLMRPHEGFEAERAALARELPQLISQMASQCLVTRSPAWTRAQPEFDDGPGFGGLSSAGYARAFFDGMEEDVVPGLEAIGLPEARGAWRDFLAGLPA